MRPILLVACALLGTLGLLSLDRCSWSPDPAPSILRTAHAVEGFELRQHGPGNFGLGYAIWANYPYVVYRGEVYRRAGPGSVVVRPAHGLTPRYLVEETTLEPERNHVNTLSELVVSDRTSGEIMARRHLRMGRSENGHGWAGQHAGEFVRKVLATDAPIGGRVGGKPYGAAAATIEVLEEEVAPPVERVGVNCPAAYRVDKRRTRIALDTGTWVFVPQSHLNSFACHGGYILVESGGGDELELDLLTVDGEHVFQAALGEKQLDYYATNGLKRVRVGKGELLVDFVHAPYVPYMPHGQRGAKAAPTRLLRATVALPPPASRAPSAKLAVK
jgi:hypothetical protein